MEDQCRVSGSNGSSYWLDACEEISCDLISDYVDFDAPIVQESVDISSYQDFFGGIEHILDSIKNGGGLPPVVSNDDSSVVNGKVIHDSIVGDGWLPNEPSGVPKNLAQNLISPPNGVEKINLERKGQENNCDNSSRNLYDCSTKENGVHRDGKRSCESRDRGFDSEERCSKRARANVCRSDRQYSSRGQYYHRDRYRCSARKRARDWDETDRRDGEHDRRREHYNGSIRRDGRDREPRGYWERDQSGSNGMVFRLGTWEADRYTEGKAANDKSLECNGKMEKKVEQPKEKLLEEQARQYQLDVLEQAKKKNAIAFLETGAGKTLIAVLLIKSICADLQKQNKKNAFYLFGS